MSLLGRLALITGAGSGIGRATCQCLAKEGATIIALDMNIDGAHKTVETLVQSPGENHLALKVSVDNAEQVKSALKESLAVYNRPPTVLVNAAGITRDNFISKLSESDFQQVLDVNLKGTFLIIQTFANALIERQIKDASIVNIGSIVTRFGNIGQANYCASKAGVELLTKVAAREYGKMGIRVNTIVPGMIQTPMFEAVPDKVKTKFISMIPLARFGQPEEVAQAVVFLASNQSSYITGASIEVAGGF